MKKAQGVSNLFMGLAGWKRAVRKTAIYISHRPAPCRFRHDIPAFDKGRVIYQGSHEALCSEDELYDELYQRLWNAQAQFYC